MANVNAIDDARHLLVFKLDGRRDKMEFIRGFPGVAERFGFAEIIYGGRARPGAGDELAEARAEWDRLNHLALTALNRGKWENRSEGQKVEALVTSSGENLSVTNA